MGRIDTKRPIYKFRRIVEAFKLIDIDQLDDSGNATDIITHLINDGCAEQKLEYYLQEMLFKMMSDRRVSRQPTPAPVAPVAAHLSDLRAFGLIHDAIVSIYGADSLEADTLRILREANIPTSAIRDRLAMALGGLMQGL